jgi:hypothetical protein
MPKGDEKKRNGSQGLLFAIATVTVMAIAINKELTTGRRKGNERVERDKGIEEKGKGRKITNNGNSDSWNGRPYG